MSERDEPHERRWIMTETEARKIARRIVKALFTNGNGQVADHLKLHSAECGYLGGWRKEAAIDCIAKVLMKSGEA